MCGVFDILSFSDRLDWRNDVSRGRQKLLLQLARDRKIVNFNPPEEWRAVLRRPLGHPPRLYHVEEKLWHFEWGYLYPRFYRQPIAVRVTGFAARMCVQYLCRKLGLASPIHLFWGPFQADLLPHLPRRFTVYYAYDMFVAYVHENEDWREHTRFRESLAASYTDLALGYSTVIVGHLSTCGFRHVYYLPVGVDYDRFALAGGLSTPRPLSEIPRPRLAFIGPARDNLDILLFDYVAQQRPDWSLVFVGGSRFIVREKQLQFELLTQLPNVHVIGHIPHESVPEYTLSIDVGLALYDVESSAYFGSPLKVYEYLAAGKPVVATPIPEVVNMGDMVYTAETPEQFVAKIEQALREDSPKRQQRRREWARQHSWENRARQMTAILEQEYTRWREGQK